MIRDTNQVEIIHVNARMNEDQVQRVVRIAMTYLQDNLTGETLKPSEWKKLHVPGFGKFPQKAPLNKLVSAAVEAFKKHNTITRLVLNLWALSKIDMAERLSDYLLNHGIQAAAPGRLGETFAVKHSLDDMISTVDRFLNIYPKFEGDDVVLMYVCLTQTFPIPEPELDSDHEGNDDLAPEELAEMAIYYLNKLAEIAPSLATLNLIDLVVDEAASIKQSLFLRLEHGDKLDDTIRSFVEQWRHEFENFEFDGVELWNSAYCNPENFVEICNKVNELSSKFNEWQLLKSTQPSLVRELKKWSDDIDSLAKTIFYLYSEISEKFSCETDDDELEKTLPTSNLSRETGQDKSARPEPSGDSNVSNQQISLETCIGVESDDVEEIESEPLQPREDTVTDPDLSEKYANIQDIDLQQAERANSELSEKTELEVEDLTHSRSASQNKDSTIYLDEFELPPDLGHSSETKQQSPPDQERLAKSSSLVSDLSDNSDLLRLKNKGEKTYTRIYDPYVSTMEIAGDILEKDDEQTVFRIRQLVWKLIEENQVGLAYHISSISSHIYEDRDQLLPPWLIKSSALALRLRHDNGVMAESLNIELGNYSDNLYLAGCSEWNHTMRLFIAAACIRPSLLAPSTNANRPLLAFHKKESLSALGDYVSLVAEFAKEWHPLDPEILLDESQRESQLRIVTEEADLWWKQAKLTTVLYTGATNVWSHWLSKGNLIHKLITPVIKNNVEDLDKVKLEINRLRDEREVKKEISRANAHIRNKRGLNRIAGKALTQLSNYLRRPLEICQSWTRLVESASGDARYADSKRARELAKKLGSLTETLILQLRDFASNNLESVPIISASKICERAISNLAALLRFEAESVRPEPSVKLVLNSDFLRIQGLELDDEWLPNNYHNDPLETLRHLLRMLALPPLDWKDVFTFHLEQMNHKATERIIEFFRQEFPHELQIHDFERTQEIAVERARDLLSRKVQETYQDIYRAMAYGTLAETKRLELHSSTEHAEQFLSDPKDFLICDEKLKSIESEMTQLKYEETVAARKRLEEGRLSSEDYQKVSLYIEQGDIFTANEYLDSITSGRGAPDSMQTENTFMDFFQEKFRFNLDDYLEKTPPMEVLSHIKRQAKACVINMNKVTGAQAQEALEMMEAWLSLKRRKSSPDLANFRTLLTRIGFEVKELEHEVGSGSKWLKLTTSPLSDKDQCPVSRYGSEARGQYRIVCFWNREGAEEIHRVVGESRHASPVLVFYFGRMTEGRRKDFVKLCFERRKTFVLIDEIVMLYLCGERGSRLHTMFRCVLPFTHLEPYTTTAGLVPPEMFYGRKAERDSIISPTGSCFLYGGRQLGKTALLRDIVRRVHDPEKGQIVIWLDLKEEGICLNREIDWIWTLITEKLKQHKVIQPLIRSYTNPDKVFSHIEEWLKAIPDRRILLLLDESDRFLDSDAQEFSPGTREGFMHVGRLKGWMDRTDRRFKVVFAGLHNVQRATKQSNQPLAHFGEPICIGPLLENGEWREARALIQLPAEIIGFQFQSKDLITRILSRTNYYPNLIQLYCQHLLRQLTNVNVSTFDWRVSPPYEIVSEHLERAYTDGGLYKAIREKFLLTLNLDARYRLIAYIIALHSKYELRESLEEGMSVDSLQREALSWWSDGFKTSSTEDSFRILLDEMVGLGVLRTCKEGRYHFRNANVIRLLGSVGDIQKALIETAENEPPGDYVASEYRAAIRLGDPERSPLTAEQESDLRSKKHGVSLIFGTVASGLDDLNHFLKSSTGPEFFHSFEETSDYDSFKEHLSRMIEGGKTRNNSNILGFVPSSCPWDETWVKHALDRTTKLRSPNSFVRIVFVIDPPHCWHILYDSQQTINDLKNRGATTFSLKPWSDLAVRQWLDDFGVVHGGEESRRKIFEKTGNWPWMLYKFHDNCLREAHKWQDLLPTLDELFSPTSIKGIVDVFGLNIDGPKIVVKALADIGEATTEELIDLLEPDQISSHMVETTIKWAERLALFQIRTGGVWNLDPLVLKIVRTAGSF